MTETKAKDIRIDFVFRVESTNETSREFVIFAEPDPRRYDWKEIDGKRHLHDRFEDLYISEEVLFDSLKTLKGKPIHYEPQRIGDVEAYMKSRESFFDRELDGGEPAKNFRDKSEEFLESLTLNKLGFVIVCLDIVGSTRMATNTEPETYARVISSILSEMSEIIPKFNGHVLKYTGDGLIAYFPEPTALTKMDLAIDCAITMHRLVHALINPLLVKRGLTTIQV